MPGRSITPPNSRGCSSRSLPTPNPTERARRQRPARLPVPDGGGASREQPQRYVQVGFDDALDGVKTGNQPRRHLAPRFRLDAAPQAEHATQRSSERLADATELFGDGVAIGCVNFP